MHLFVSWDTVAFHHCVLGKSWVWLFLLGLAPFAFCFVSLLDGEAHIWLGDLRFASCGWCLWFVCAFDLPSYMTTCVYVDFILTGSSHCWVPLQMREIFHLGPNETYLQSSVCLAPSASAFPLLHVEASNKSIQPRFNL